MKRILIIILVSIVFISNFSISVAEPINFTLMSFDELEAIKLAVDNEYYSRPESSGIRLNVGTYTVGIDIKPGHYYAAMVEPDFTSSNTFMSIYTDAETFAAQKPYYTDLAKFAGYFFLSQDPQIIVLEENNIVSITNGSLLLKSSLFNPLDYYKYDPPEGTFVSRGTYTVGVEIPSGTYIVYPGTVNGGVYKIKKIVDDKEKSSSASLYIRKEVDCNKIVLEDGDVLEVTYSIVMAIPKALEFSK